MAHDQDRRIVIVGKTGNGKSSLGNNLLEKEAFDCRRSKKAVTTSCAVGTTTDNKKKIIDTPGLFSPTAGNNVAKQALDILESLNICDNPHAFLLVMRDDCRCTEEDLSTEDVLEITFGPEFFQRAIIVFTHVANETSDKQFEEEWKESSELTSLIEKCGNRVARIENMKVNSAYINQIFSYVDEVSRNGSEKYLNKYKNCQREVLQNMAKFDKFDRKNARDQVSSLSKKITQAIEKEEQTRELRLREESVAKREVSVTEKEKSVSRQEASVKEKEKSVLGREVSVKKKEESVSRREVSVKEKEKSVSRREVSVKEKEESVSGREVSVKVKEESVSRRERSVTEKEKSISSREGSVTEQEESVSRREGSVDDREESVSSREDSVAEKEKSVSSREEYVAERDKIVSGREKSVAEREESLTKKIWVTVVAAGAATAASGGVRAALAKATGAATAANWLTRR